MAVFTLSRIIALFIIVWIIVYIVVYNWIMAPSDGDVLTPTGKARISATIADTGTTTNTRRKTSFDGRIAPSMQALANPFVSPLCQYAINMTRNPATASAPFKQVSVVIPARDESKADLIGTVTSVLANSGALLKEIIVVDDLSATNVAEWPEWQQLSVAYPQFQKTVKLLRAKHRLGVAGAKSYGAKQVDRKSGGAVAFLDAHVVVSKDWLLPLVQTLQEHPNALVYPAIDVLHVGQAASGSPGSRRVGFIQADNVLGAFDWSLKFRWELVNGGDSDALKKRLPLVGESPPESDETATSPAAPGIFLVALEFYDRVGGIDTHLGLWGQDSVELSIRAWMCGGAVIRAPCSRVAHRYDHVEQDAKVRNGITEAIVDFNVMSIAERYMRGEPAFKEAVYQSRFLGRVPYTVDVAQGDRFPSNLMSAEPLTSGSCQSFGWFTKEVYPGLLEDMPSVAQAFQAHIESDYLRRALSMSGLLEQYSKRETPGVAESMKAHSAEAAFVGALKDSADEKSIQDTHDSLIPPKVLYMHPNLYEFKGLQGSAVDQIKTAEEETQSTPKKTFLMPKKAAVVKSNNPAPTKKLSEEARKEAEMLALMMPVLPKAPEGDAAGVAPVVPATVIVDPYTAQRKFAAGELPDPDASSSNPCQLNGTPNGELLARVDLLDSGSTRAKPVKIFCGIYTMEKNHESNVKATRDTWAKRCDGFVAFSTKDDPSLPAMRIEHEGEEAYDNMWQKSRSIWKFIAEHFTDQFDFFLLGGDDMFYVMDNLRAFLGSSEITDLPQSKENTGLFVGRRFFPPKQEVFNSGGAGYILDRAALKILQSNIDSPKCFPHQKGFWEDVNVANCLRVSAHILPIDTRDSSKRERFHPFTPGQHLTYRIPKQNPDWYPKYNPELKEGFDCCSPNSISFHYSPADLTRKLHNYVYHCANKVKSGNFGNI